MKICLERINSVETSKELIALQCELLRGLRAGTISRDDAEMFNTAIARRVRATKKKHAGEPGVHSEAVRLSE
jgi:hypothetical protein